MTERAKIKFLLLTIVAIIKALISTILAALVGIKAIPYALEERGYVAFGGEWVLVICSFFVTYIILTFLFEAWLKTPPKKDKKNG